MPEQVSMNKAKQQPHKPLVRTPASDNDSASPSKLEPITLSTSTQTFSPEQLIHLQRTVGNKAVGEILRRQKANTPSLIQRDGEEDEPVSGRRRSTESVSGPAPLPPAPSPAPLSESSPSSASPAPESPASPSSTPAPASASGAAPASGISSPTAQSGPLAADAEKGGFAGSDVIATEAEMRNPVLALKTYRKAVGVHLREGKRHKFKIERYKAFIEADYVHLKTEIPSVISEDRALLEQEAIKNQPAKALKKLQERRKKLDERKKKVGGDNLLQTEAQAEARVQKAYNASVVAESELPIIEYAYDTLVQMRHENLEGSKSGLMGYDDPKGSIREYKLRIKEAEKVINGHPLVYSAEAKAANRKYIVEYRQHIAKHEARLAVIENAKKDLVKAQTLRGQAKLSEDMMAVKRKQLKVEKATIKGGAGRGVTFGDHLGSKVTTAAGGVVLSTVTLGLVELEQNKVDGGYTSKREVVTMLDTWKRDWATLKAVWTARPYGKMTALHLFFQGLGTLILKPLRKVFTAASLIFTGLSLIPGVAVVTGPLAAFCTMVTLGLVAAKVALDSLLATWSALTLALNKNAHNTDVLRGQATGQAADVAGGAIAAAAAFAVPAIGSAAGGQYVNPLQNMTSHGGSVMNYAPGGAGATGDIGHQLAQQAQVQSAKLPSTLAMVIAEKGLGAVAELEAMGDGAKALFAERQKLILAHNLPETELAVEIEKAKLAAAEYAEGKAKKDIIYYSKPAPDGNPVSLANAQKRLLAAQQQQTRSKERIAAVESGTVSTSSPTATPSTPTTATPIAPPAPSSPPAPASGVPTPSPAPVALPAQGQFAARMNPEVEKEKAIRAASTQALAAKAKSQVQGLASSLGESQTQGAQVASGAQAAQSSVGSAGQGVQPADAPNASAAQSNVSAAQEVIQQIVEVVGAAPEAIDEAQAPTPAA